MIERDLPRTWRELQDSVARILRESGFKTYVEKTVKTARGPVNVDVLAIDRSKDPEASYLFECKHWKKRVTKGAVRDFRSTVSDYGGNCGLIVSSSGFQSGAPNASKFTNVRCLTWDEFQNIFTNRWFEQYFVSKLLKANEALVEYTEPINS